MAESEEFIAELVAKTPIAALVGQRVKLTKSGKSWKGCCPFHGEKTPSFYVYENHFHCFGCGEHGNAIAFLMKADKLEEGAAIKQLAAQAGLTVPGVPVKGTADPAPAQPVISATRLSGSAKEAAIFQNGRFEAVLGTAARILIQQKNLSEASILANGQTSVTHWSHDNWDGGQDIWRLYIGIAVDTYLELSDREAVEATISKAISVPMNVLSPVDFIEVEITTTLEDDPDWRLKARQLLSGEGVNNQGRAHSANIAAREYNGLRFRSLPEELFYRAMRQTALPFAPLPVVVQGGAPGRRVEPDFVVFKHGIVMVVEIDGDTYHTEKPSDAHARLKFLTDQGVIVERINAAACDTPEKAKEAARGIVAALDRHKASR